MTRSIAVLAFIFLIGCNQTDKKKIVPHTDTTVLQKGSSKNIINGKDSKDSVLLMDLSFKILTTIKKKDYHQFSSFIHPTLGTRFSPYANIDTNTDKIFLPLQFEQIASEKKPINWGSSWGEDSVELLTIDQYFNNFVYDVDFLVAPTKSINKFHSYGTDSNNIADIYPEAELIEFYFPGFEKKYDGMDFRGLRLVFMFYNKLPYLVSIVHDQWTP